MSPKLACYVNVVSFYLAKMTKKHLHIDYHQPCFRVATHGSCKRWPYCFCTFWALAVFSKLATETTCIDFPLTSGENLLFHIRITYMRDYSSPQAPEHSSTLARPCPRDLSACDSRAVPFTFCMSYAVSF